MITNKKSNLDLTLGWYTSALYRDLFLDAYGAFPLLQIVGHVGTGKTYITNQLLTLFQNLGGAEETTPDIFDGYRPSQYTWKHSDKTLAKLRNNYSKLEYIDDDGEHQSGAPIVLISEHVEQELALLERFVVVEGNFKLGLPALADFQDSKQEVLAKVGQNLWVELREGYAVSDLKEEFTAIFESCNEELPDSERLAFNYAVAEFGLMKFKKTLAKILH